MISFSKVTDQRFECQYTQHRLHKRHCMIDLEQLTNVQICPHCGPHTRCIGRLKAN